MADGSRSAAPESLGVDAIALALGRHKRSVEMRAVKEAWPFQVRAGRGGKKRYYQPTLLPDDVRDALQRHRAITAAEALQPTTTAYRDGNSLGRKLAIADTVDAAVATRRREQGTATAAGLTGKRKARMDAKLELLQRLGAFAHNRGLRVCAAMDDFCDVYNSGAITVSVEVRQLAGGVVHPSTLRRWRKTLKEQGPAALAGNYGNRTGTGKLDTDQDLRHFVIGLLAEKPHISAKLVSEALDARFGDSGKALPDPRSVQRWLKKWKADNAETFQALTNPDAWKNRYMAGFGSLSENVTRACQLWMLDSTPADLQLEDGRYSLVGLIDVAWRGLRLYVTKTSTAEAVCQIMRRGILELGVPEAIKCDNGKDYVSDRVAGLLTSLEIEPRFSAPFSPWEKGNIERAFRTFSHSLLELLPGYCGHNVAEAQALRARESFADRLFKKNAVVELKLTAAQLQDFCDRWCRDYYAHQAHSGLNGDTPFQRFAQLRDVVRRVEDPRALDLLLGAGEMRTVTKKGLRVDRLTYIAPELAGVIGQQVLVRVDDADIGRAVVYHQEQFLCVAECPEVTGVSRREIAIESKAQQTKRVQQAKAELKAAKRKANTRDIAWEILDRKAQLHGNVASFPAPNVHHLTPALEAASEAADALDAEAAPLDAQPTTEAHVAEVAQLLRDESALDETAQDRFRRALRAQLAERNGERDDLGQRFLQGYRESSEYRGNWMVFESFGAGTFGLGDEYNALLPADAPFLSTQGVL